MSVFSAGRIIKYLFRNVSMSKSTDALELPSKVLTWSTAKYSSLFSAKRSKNDVQWGKGL